MTALARQWPLGCPGASGRVRGLLYPGCNCGKAPPPAEWLRTRCGVWGWSCMCSSSAQLDPDGLQSPVSVLPTPSPLHKPLGLTTASSCSSSVDKKPAPWSLRNPSLFPRTLFLVFQNPQTPFCYPGPFSCSPRLSPDPPGSSSCSPRTHFLAPQHYHILQGLSSP